MTYRYGIKVNANIFLNMNVYGVASLWTCGESCCQVAGDS